LGRSHMRILDIGGEISFDSSTDGPGRADVTDLEHESPNANTLAPTSADSVDRVVVYTPPHVIRSPP
ncbi:MAG: hypothetical protein L0G69_15005, partial [Brevibacterium sp.]|nr:hypothetical protein [Brevibacterium sp.]